MEGWLICEIMIWRAGSFVKLWYGGLVHLWNYDMEGWLICEIMIWRAGSFVKLWYGGLAHLWNYDMEGWLICGNYDTFIILPSLNTNLQFISHYSYLDHSHFLQLVMHHSALTQ